MAAKLVAHPNRQRLPHEVEIDTARFFTNDDWAREGIWEFMRSDQARGLYAEYWSDDGSRTFVAFSHARTAFAFKMRFGGV